MTFVDSVIDCQQQSFSGLHFHVQFLLGVKMAPRETENNAHAKFWGDKQRALWYVMVFSGVVNIIAAYFEFCSSKMMSGYLLVSH